MHKFTNYKNPQSNISTPYPNSWFMHYPNPDTWLGSEVGHGLGFVGRENIRLWIFVVCESSSTACVTQTHRCILPVTWCHRNSICNFKISRSPTFSPIKSECGMSIVYIATPHRKHQFQSFKTNFLSKIKSLASKATDLKYEVKIQGQSNKFCPWWSPHKIDYSWPSF